MDRLHGRGFVNMFCIHFNIDYLRAFVVKNLVFYLFKLRKIEEIMKKAVTLASLNLSTFSAYRLNIVLTGNSSNSLTLSA
jgi:hypothetical protein